MDSGPQDTSSASESSGEYHGSPKKWYEKAATPAATAARRARNQPLVEEYKSKTPCEFCGVADQNTKFHVKPGNKKFARWHNCSVGSLHIQFNLHLLFHIGCWRKYQLDQAKQDKQFKLGIINDGIKMYLLGESPRVPSFIYIPYNSVQRSSNNSYPDKRPPKSVEEALRGF